MTSCQGQGISGSPFCADREPAEADSSGECAGLTGMPGKAGQGRAGQASTAQPRLGRAKGKTQSPQQVDRREAKHRAVGRKLGVEEDMQEAA